jgi:mRNA-decapping enzyme subunit 2
VKEEVGYDVGPLLDPTLYLEHSHEGQTVRLYLIQGVPETTAFHTQTRKEISVRGQAYVSAFGLCD